MSSGEVLVVVITSSGCVSDRVLDFVSTGTKEVWCLPKVPFSRVAPMTRSDIGVEKGDDGEMGNEKSLTGADSIPVKAIPKRARVGKMLTN